MSSTFATSLVQLCASSGLEMNVHLVFKEKPTRLEQKILTLSKYIQKYPEGWKKRLELANLLYQMGDWQQAVAEYRQVIERQPQLIGVRLQLGKMLQIMGRKKEAVEVYEKALFCSDNEGTQHHIKGLIAVCRGESDKAIIAFSLAASLEPDKVVHWLALAQVHQQIENHLGVLSAVEQVLSINPDDVVALIYSHDASQAVGDIPAARGKLSKVIAQLPNDFRVLQREIEQRCQMRLVSGIEGLAVHANWLTESYYGERDESKPGIDGNRVLQYFLDKFATVKEVVEDFEKNKDMQFIPTKIKKGDLEQEVQCHLAMEDAQGESVIVEYLRSGDGSGNDVERNIYYSGDIPDYSIEYNVLTNSPPFKDQLSNLKKYKGFGGELDLPGTSAAADRFVRGAFYLKSLPEPANQREAIAGVLSVMRSTAQPFRVPDSGAPYASSTRWRTVAAITEKLYLYESSLYPTLIWLDAKKLDFTKGGVRVFDLTKNREAIGDVSEKLTPAEDPFGNNLSQESGS